MIPARNEAARIAAAVTSARAAAPVERADDVAERLGGQTREGGGVEVLVVDGGSHDATVQRALEAGARVRTSKPGRAQQLACGVAATKSPLLVFLHADSRLPGGYAAAIRQALAAPDVVGGAFALRFDEAGAALRIVEWGVRMRLRLLRLPFGDQALFLRRTALDAIGGVPQAPIMEDVDLVQALKRQGRLVFLPASVRSSARRYLERGVFRTVLRNAIALLARALGVPRARIAAWYQR